MLSAKRPNFAALLPPSKRTAAASTAAASTAAAASASSCAASASAAPPAPARDLKIVSWNVGLRGLPVMCSPHASDQYGAADCHGIRRKQSYGGLRQLLEATDADIVCLQEVKMRELGAHERALALADGWDSYFSLCRVRSAGTSHGRYSGVATFCRTACRPRAAEEGVSGVLAQQSATSAAAGGVGHAERVAADLAPSRMSELDGEGRGVITVHGDLAIFNLYVPTLGKDASTEEEVAARHRREAFKLDLLRAVELRAAALRAAGHRVLLIGDFNIAPHAHDRATEAQHAGGAGGAGGAAASSGVPSSLSRRWLHRMLACDGGGGGGGDDDGDDGGGRGDDDDGGGGGFGAAPPPPLRFVFADCFRRLHPARRGAYTCFNVAAGADLFNYGSRIDLALLSPPPCLSPPPAVAQINGLLPTR